jgi:hypothetical protein
MTMCAPKHLPAFVGVTFTICIFFISNIIGASSHDRRRRATEGKAVPKRKVSRLSGLSSAWKISKILMPALPSRIFRLINDPFNILGRRLLNSLLPWPSVYSFPTLRSPMTSHCPGRSLCSRYQRTVKLDRLYSLLTPRSQSEDLLPVRPEKRTWKTVDFIA